VQAFLLFESSEVRAQLKDKLGGREIAMSRLQDWLVEALNAENVTIPPKAHSMRLPVSPEGRRNSLQLPEQWQGKRI
jgi:hypothetical protein